MHILALISSNLFFIILVAFIRAFVNWDFDFKRNADIGNWTPGGRGALLIMLLFYNFISVMVIIDASNFGIF